jgi:hypothetical protein
MVNNEENATAHDIKNNVLRFNGARCYHKNAEHTGDRIVMVFFNTDFSSHDRWRGLHGPDELTEEIRRQPVVTVPECIPIKSDETCITLRNNILKEVEKVDWMNRQQVKYNGKSSMILFGHVLKPYQVKARNITAASIAYPELHKTLNDYIDHIIGPDTANKYSTILLAKNSQCNWHLDKQNIGSSLIHCIGDFEGGELLVNSKEPQPLFECMQCHLSHAALRKCRTERQHTAPDWISPTWNYIKAGALEKNMTTRRAIKKIINVMI